MNILYDYQILLAQRYGGISRYFYELYSRIPKFGTSITIKCVHNHNYYFRKELGLVDMSGKNKFFRLSELGFFWYLNKLKTLRDIKRVDYDIIHPTYYYASYLAGKTRGKIILTVHDMTHEKYIDKYSSLNPKLIAAKKKMIYASDRIICVSENTRKDLLAFYPDVNSEKISVIYHGSSMKNVTKRRFSRMDGRDYVLFVGDRRMYKNFANFVKAMTMILGTHKGLQVFCAGGGNFTPEEIKMFGEYSSRFHQAGLNDNELEDAYMNALCFVFPSEYEGFGIPILEAFACECPVICSSTSSLPEVAGDAAEYFDPINTEDIAAKILKVIDNETLRTKMKARGLERLKLFDWDKTARETLECYKLAR